MDDTNPSADDSSAAQTSDGSQLTDDALDEEERKRLMIQGYENKKIMEENVAGAESGDEELDPMLMMDQASVNLETGEITPDRLEESEEDRKKRLEEEDTNANSSE